MQTNSKLSCADVFLGVAQKLMKIHVITNMRLVRDSDFQEIFATLCREFMLAEIVRLK